VGVPYSFIFKELNCYESLNENQIDGSIILLKNKRKIKPLLNPKQFIHTLDLFSVFIKVRVYAYVVVIL
jgi:hypothetical protein